MPTIFINLPHDKGSFEIELKNDRQLLLLKEFLNIIEKYSLNIDKKDLENIVHISSL